MHSGYLLGAPASEKKNISGYCFICPALGMDFIHITLHSSMGMVSRRDKRERTIFYGGSHRVKFYGGPHRVTGFCSRENVALSRVVSLKPCL